MVARRTRRCSMIAESKPERADSAMLRTVPKAARLLTFLTLAVALAAFAGTGGERSGESLRPVQQPSSSAPSQPQAPKRTIQTVVLDPAHGGTDQGAHGATGIV